MSVLNELIEYRERYVKRADEKINRTFLSMIDRSIDYIKELEHKCEREKRIHLCYGIDQRLLYKVIELPDIVFSRLIEYIENNELETEEAEEIIYDILYWERRTQLTIEEFYSLKRDKTLIAELHSRTPEIAEFKEFQEFEDVIKKNIDEFQNRTRLIVSVSLYNEVLDEDRKLILRNKYLNYLFDKYDKRRNR